MNVVGVLRYWYFGCAALSVLYVRCIIGTLCALRYQYFMCAALSVLYTFVTLMNHRLNNLMKYELYNIR